MINTLNAKNEKDFQDLDLAIDAITQEVTSKVEGAFEFGVMTACFIDGEFVLVSNYDLELEMIGLLKEAAEEIQ